MATLLHSCTQECLIAHFVLASKQHYPYLPPTSQSPPFVCVYTCLLASAVVCRRVDVCKSDSWNWSWKVQLNSEQMCTNTWMCIATWTVWCMVVVVVYRYVIRYIINYSGGTKLQPQSATCKQYDSWYLQNKDISMSKTVDEHASKGFIYTSARCHILLVMLHTIPLILKICSEFTYNLLF